MSFIPGILLVSALASWAPSTTSNSQHQAIKGGTVDGSVAAIGRVVGHTLWIPTRTCSGTLVAPGLVLTAAHCIQEDAGQITFEVTDPDDGTKTVASFAVKTALAHPAYKAYYDDEKTHTEHDVAMLILTDEVPSSVATPAPLHRAALTDDLVNTSVLAVGYGGTGSDGEGAGTKRSVQLWIASFDELRIGLWPHDMEGVTDGAPQEIDGGLCSGDSGGPDLFVEGDGTRSVIGVHSMGSHTCAASESTRIDVHLQDFLDPIMTGDVPPGCEGSTLTDAVCLPELEGTCSAGLEPHGVGTLAVALLAARRRRRPRG